MGRSCHVRLSPVLNGGWRASAPNTRPGLGQVARFETRRPLAPKASAGRVRSREGDCPPAPMWWWRLVVMVAVVGRCYTAATPRGSRRLILALSKVVMLSLRFAVPPCCGNPPNISVNKGRLAPQRGVWRDGWGRGRLAQGVSMIRRAKITLLTGVAVLAIAGAGTGVASGQSADPPPPTPPPPYSDTPSPTPSPPDSDSPSPNSPAPLWQLNGPESMYPV
jgi:hypothetical protein